MKANTCMGMTNKNDEQIRARSLILHDKKVEALNKTQDRYHKYLGVI